MTNTVAWFEVGTADPDAARSFYGDLFGWSFARQEGVDYTPIVIDGQQVGGIAGTGGTSPSYAVFYVIVADVQASCDEAKRLGGQVVSDPLTTPDGLTFAHITDPAGSRFGVFTPAR